MALKKYEIDMTTGSMVKNIAAFVFPLMLSNLLQLLYNAADIIVVGQFAGSDSLAAVGATTALIGMIVNLFIGLSVGTSALISRHYGANDWKRMDDAVHTSVVLSMIGGAICCAVGIGCSKPILHVMGTPDNVLQKSVLYVRIIFIGAPASMFYNFGAAILRAVGDTKRPLYFLTVSGLVNVGLNLLLVIVFHLGVAGVAIATIVSQYLSAGLLAFCLLTADTSYQLVPRRLRLHKKELVPLLKIGLPAGINSCIFGFSNMIIQSAVNSFGSTVMAGVAAAQNIENFVYNAMNAMMPTVLTATAQNVGAKQKKRIYGSLRVSLAFVTLIGLISGCLCVVFRYPLLHIYSPDTNVIEVGSTRMLVVCMTYFLCGIMEVETGYLRGLGYSVLPMLANLSSVCGVRLTWIYTVFAARHTPVVLYLAWTVSWVAAVTILYACILIVRRRALRKLLPSEPPCDSAGVPAAN